MTTTAWELPMNPSRFLQRHPRLGYLLASTRCKCGAQVVPDRPIVMAKYVGIIASDCSSCGEPGVNIWIKNDKHQETIE